VKDTSETVPEKQYVGASALFYWFFPHQISMAFPLKECRFIAAAVTGQINVQGESA